MESAIISTRRCLIRTFPDTVRRLAAAIAVLSVVAFPVSSTAQEETPVPVEYNEQVQDSIDQPGDYNLYEFEGSSGDELYFDVTDGLYWNEYTCTAPDDTQLWRTDRDHDLFVLDQEGTYTLRADPRLDPDATGSYAFTLNLVGPQSPVETGYEARVDERIHPAGDRDVFVFEAHAGDRVYVDVSREHSGIRFAVNGPGGENIFEDINKDTGPHLLPKAGAYELTVDASGDVTGTYSFRVKLLFDSLDLPPLKGYSMVETIAVPSDGSAVASTSSLQQDVPSLFRAFGVIQGGSRLEGVADAEFRNAAGEPGNVRDLASGGEVDFGIAVTDETVDLNRFPDWGAFNPKHFYTAAITGAGEAVELSLHDSDYNANRGEFTVEIWLPETVITAPLNSGTIAVGDHLRFLGSAPVLAPGGAVSYKWDFGNGRHSEVEDPGVVRFPDTGEFQVRFETTGLNGQESAGHDTRTITVVDPEGAPPDLEGQSLEVPPGAALGENFSVTYTAQNAGEGTLTGAAWADAVYLSADSVLDASDTLLTTEKVELSLEPGAEYSRTVELAVPDADPGAYYLILSLDDAWDVLEAHQLNNELAASLDSGLPDLTGGTSASGKFEAQGESAYFQVTVEEGESLRVILDDPNDTGTFEIYARFNDLPSRTAYDAMAGKLSSSGQSLTLPAPAPGTWFIMVYGVNVPDAGNYTVKAETASLLLSSVYPQRHGDSAEVTLSLEGAGFDQTAGLELIAPEDTAYPASETTSVSFEKLTATIAAGTVPPGLYTIRVENAQGEEALLPDAFEMLSGGNTDLDLNLVVPKEVGYHQLATVLVEYENRGDVAMPAPLLVVSAIQNGERRALLTLDDSRISRGFWTSAVPEGFSNTISILANGRQAGTLGPGESGQVPVYYAGWQQPWDYDYPPIEFNLSVVRATNTEPANWEQFESALRPKWVQENAWKQVWQNFQDDTGSTWGDFVRMLDANAAHLESLGDPACDFEDLLTFELVQADGIGPVRLLASSVDCAVQARGLPIVFARFLPASIMQRAEPGTLGAGWDHNWDVSLLEADDGTVTVEGPGNLLRTFQPDTRGGYFAAPGDQGRLEKQPDGSFRLTEKHGGMRRFTAGGQLEYAEDTNGNRLTLEYTEGHLSRITHSGGQWLELHYNAGGNRLERITDHNGRETVFEYSSDGSLLTGVTYYDGRTISYTYERDDSSAAFHALTGVEYPGGTHLYIEYNPAGHVAEIYGDNGTAGQSFTYGGTGDVTVTNAGGDSSKVLYGRFGGWRRIIDPLGNPLGVERNRLGLSTKLIGADGYSTAFEYDERGNPVKALGRNGTVTCQTYEATFNALTSVTDAKEQVTEYEIDPANGNLTAIRYPDASQEEWTHSGWGAPQSWTNRRGTTVEFSYDADGRLTRKDYADGSFAEFKYDDRGNLIEAINSSCTVAFQYNDKDWMTRVDYPGGRYLEYSYDAAGRRTRMEDQDGFAVTYHYDAAGRLSELRDADDNLLVAYTYDDTGRIQREEKGNGTATEYEYDEAGRTTTIRHLTPEGTLQSEFGYEYNRRTQRTLMATPEGNWEYEYDLAGNLKQVRTPGGRLISYQYDAAGNRTKVIDNGVETGYQTNNMNQYTGAGDTEFIYDTDGNLIEKTEGAQTWSYTYDEENRLLRVDGPGGVVEYEYDALGHRIAIIDKGVRQDLVVDPVGLGWLAGVYQGESAETRYVYGAGLAAQIESSGEPSYYNFDVLGSAVSLTDGSGAQVNRYRYLPFGDPAVQEETVANRFTYAGRWGITCETGGLYRMRARYYDAATGRFISPDPTGQRSGLQLYRYAYNNPVAFTDLSGAEPTQMDVPAARGPGAAPASVHPRSPDTHSTSTKGRKRDYDSHPDATGYFTTPNVRPCYAPHASVPSSGQKVAKGKTYGDIDVPINDKNGGVELNHPPPPTSLGGKKLAFDLSEDIAYTDAPTAGYAGLTLLPAVPGGRVAMDAAKLASGLASYMVQQFPPAKALSEAAGSVDPNQKLGPAGAGGSRYVAPGQPIPYRIDFENDPEATAPAQVVVVTDELSGKLNWQSLQLRECGFGDHLIPVPSGRQHFEHVEPMTLEGTNFEVQIEVEFDARTGRLTATFASIDPKWGIPPPVDTGFLPPEDGTGAGQGHVSFVVNARDGLATGAEIRNVARITFDYGETIATNQVDPHDPSQGTDPDKEAWSTIDADPPEGQLQWFRKSGDGSAVELSLTGTDTGSRIAGFDVLMEFAGRAVTAWETVTGLTGIVDLMWESVANIFVRPEDAAGNQGTLPEEPDAVLRVPSWAFPLIPAEADHPVMYAALHPDATEGWDADFDEEPLNPPPGGVRAVFVSADPEHPELVYDVKPDKETVVWTIEVRSGGLPVELSWDPENVPDNRLLKLVRLNEENEPIPETGVDLRQQSNLKIEEAGRFALTLSPAPGQVRFIRGDANATDGRVDISDAIFVLSYLFSDGRRPDCFDACDKNDDGAVDLSDAVSILLSLFGGAPPPVLQCEVDETVDSLPRCDYPEELCDR